MNRRALLVSTLLLLPTLASGEDVSSLRSSAPPASAVGRMVVYRPGEPVPQEQLMDFGDPADLGGEVLAGSPRISGRIDFAQDGVMAGIFQATRGLVRIHFPFDEHATILHGTVTITDETGQQHTYKPGDSYFMRAGSVVLWDVQGPYMQKSFFNVMPR